MSIRTKDGAERRDSAPGSQLVSIKDAAKRLGICRKSLENLLYIKNRLRPVRLGLRRVMVRESDLEKLVREGLR